jgi:hypothetical protein
LKGYAAWKFSWKRERLIVTQMRIRIIKKPMQVQVTAG